ncbi:MAG: LysM peptidoglycan-binding domain-containing protein [Gammaproteobacteria bacterium]|nr:LysM peptidoglycan-binding domain-containing protein [Gammaproteobacteria bacterium]
MQSRFKLITLLLLMLMLACARDPVKPAPDSPEMAASAPTGAAVTATDTPPQRVQVAVSRVTRYTVKPGDTLWGIARHLLGDPWRWREVWRSNSDIQNPDRIYPGDVLRLSLDETGRAQLGIASRALPLVRLSPQARIEPLEPEAVPTVDKVVLDKFLARARVVGEDELEDLPYVLGSAERRLLGGSAGDEIYALNLANDGRTEYSIYKRGAVYRDSDDDVLGYELIQVADARLVRFGTPSVLRLTQTSYLVNKGYFVLPRQEKSSYQFIPQSAPRESDGRILSVFGGIQMIGQYDAVSLNLGREQGIEPGHVFGVFQPRDAQRDPISGRRIEGYDRRAGVLMVYESYAKFSHAVVMEARVPLRVGDLVGRP